MNIFWLTNLSSPYRVDFFNMLGEKYNLTVVFEQKKSQSRNDKWFNYDFKNFNALIEKNFLKIIKTIKSKKFDHIFICDISSISSILVILYLIFSQKKYYLEIDGGFPNKRKNIKELIKKIIVSNADYCFNTSKLGSQYLKKYGAKKNKIVQYPLSSFFEHEIIKSPLNEIEKEKGKQKLNIPEKHVLTFIGSFIDRKGIDRIFNMAHYLKKTNLAILLIGGSKKTEYDLLEKNIKNTKIYYLGFLDKKTTRKYLEISDLFIFPTRADIWGLVVGEAQSCGVPVISTNTCVAAMEIINQNKNGFIVQFDDEQKGAQEMATYINQMLTDKKKLAKMSASSIEVSHNYTIEKMVQAHISFLEKK